MDNFDELFGYTIILNDEDGNDLKFEFLDLIELDDEEYVVLLPIDAFDDSEEVVILKLEGMDEESRVESYVTVDSEDTLEKVFSVFKEKYKYEFNFHE